MLGPRRLVRCAEIVDKSVGRAVGSVRIPLGLVLGTVRAVFAAGHPARRGSSVGPESKENRPVDAFTRAVFLRGSPSLCIV